MTKIIAKDLNYYKKLDKKVEMIPLTSYGKKNIMRSKKKNLCNLKALLSISKTTGLYIEKIKSLKTKE